MRIKFTLLPILLFCHQLLAQTTITFTVDATNFVNAGGILVNNQVSIAGNFTERGGNLPDWNPAAGLMTRQGNTNIYSINVVFNGPAIATDSLVWKYVQGTSWNDGDEGNDWNPPHRTCTRGNFNDRKLLIPTSGEWTVTSAWAQCHSLTDNNALTIITSAASAIGQTAATISGTASGSGINARGIAYATNQNPTISDEFISSGSGAGSFSANLTGISPNTLYYARAYITVGNTTTYGNQIQFTTLPAQVQTVSVTYKVDITNYLAGGATLGANGIRIGGNFTTRGASLPDWTPSAAACAMTNEGNNIWSITVVYPDTAIGKVQRYKFVNNDWGTNEGSDSLLAGGCAVLDGFDINRVLTIPADNTTVSFCWDRCAACVPLVQNSITTNPATNITQTTATISAVAVGQNIAARGIAYATTPEPTILSSLAGTGFGAGTFSANLTGLLPNTLYYARAYITVGNTTTYGNQIQFTTLPAQVQTVSVTYKVDITNYLAGGATLGANGIRIGGNFTTRGASLPDWTPSAAACAMTNEGNNIWSITVSYPDTAIGKVQRYKFVNNDWGTNEGSDSLLAGGCAVLDGFDINRVLTIPAANTTVSFCWDRCAACLTTQANPFEKNNEISLSPNPFSNELNISNFSSKSYGTYRILNLLGMELQSGYLHGENTRIMTKDLPAGIYYFHLTGIRNPIKIVKN